MSAVATGPTQGRSEYSWAIAAIGAALVALFIAAAATGAAGKTIPTELLAAAGALSGALVGVLVPPPAATQAAIAGASVIHSAAVSAASNQATQIEADPNSTDQDKAAAGAELAAVVATSKQRSSQVRGKAAVEEAVGRYAAEGAGPVAKAAADAATGASDDAVLAASAARTAGLILDGGKVVVPLVIFVIALYFGLSMSNGHIRYAGCPVGVLKSGETQAPCATALFQTANAMITLASATAGALVGLFAPSPGQSS